MNPENTPKFEIPAEDLPLVEKIMGANSGLAPEEAYAKFKVARQKYNWPIDPFFASIAMPGQDVLSGRNRLLFYKELNMSGSAEEHELQAVLADFQAAAAEVGRKTGQTPEVAMENIEHCLGSGVAETLAEAKEILSDPPMVKGFEESELDPKISNSRVKAFLENTFGTDVFEKLKLVKIGKDDAFFIYTGRNSEAMSKAIKMKGGGLLKSAGGMDLHQAKNRSDYEQAEMVLEGKDSVSELTHDFKVRAEAGAVGNKGKLIRLKTFCVEQPKDYDYLDGLELNEDDKKRAFILGTLVHEVGHHIARTFDEEASREYTDIVNTEVSSKREKYSTDYVLKHEKLYNSDPGSIVHDDFCESVRIYTTNPKYLTDNYPRRYSFIKEHFPWIKENSVVNFFKQKTSI